ncbi:S-layer homology domain-containing protein [uncultured Tyzzerella sp.]|uniref:S-layer homology domain-containing protein n=1 Tax=uncultured Tyzzerella sp. TaxID=2321398 RepID=UPI0029439926|nr:S-layer homology domain-containing protein [uncultured Tyzzerella sp.]
MENKKSLVATLAVILASSHFGGSIAYAKDELSFLTEEELKQFKSFVDENDSLVQNDDTLEYDENEVVEVKEKNKENLFEEKINAVNKVEVSTYNDFMRELKKGNNHIVVTKSITVLNDSSGQADDNLIPVEFPGNVTIEGKAGTDAALVFRSPIQLTGDNVRFKDIELNFISSSAIGGVGHREIFLAGHSLIFENVNCYTKGAGGSLGGFGSQEDELLPEIYAGAYKNTSSSKIGNHAQFTVERANSNTKIKAIYTGNESGNYGMVPYNGNTTISLDYKTIVREGINATKNTGNVLIELRGAKGVSLSGNMEIFGNDKTTLVVRDIVTTGIKVKDVENIELKGNAVYEPFPTDDGAVIKNIKIEKDSTLNLRNMFGTRIKGNFESNGNLILDSNDTLIIDGNISGKTVFKTWGNTIADAGNLQENKDYIICKNESNGKFSLNPLHTGYKIKQVGNNLQVEKEIAPEDRVFGSMEIVSGPTSVFLNELIDNNGDNGNPKHYKHVIKCLDINNVEYNPQVYAAVIPIKDYENKAENWESEIELYLANDQEKYGTYYFQAATFTPESLVGKYKVLFMIDENKSLDFEDEIKNSSVEQLIGMKKAEMDLTVHKNPDNTGAKSIDNAVVSQIPTQTYTGKEIKPVIQVTLDGQTLEENTDFIVTYENNINITTEDRKAKVKIDGIGKYKGTLNKEFEIGKVDAHLEFTRDKEEYTYGEEIKFTFKAKANPNSRRFARSVEKNEVEFKYGDKVLGKVPVVNGQAHFIYNTKSNIIQIGQGTVTATYGGSDELNGQSKEVSVVLNKATINKDNIKNVVLENFVYDGTTKETNIQDVEWNNNDLAGAKLRGKATVAKADVGIYNIADIKELKLTGDSAKWYELEGQEFTGVPANVEILKATLSELIKPTEVIKSNQVDFSINFSSHLPKGVTPKTKQVGNIANSDVLFETVPTIDVDNNILKFKLKNNINVKEFSIPIELTYDNYKDLIIEYNFKITDKTPINLKLNAPNIVYSGNGYDSWSVDGYENNQFQVKFYDITNNKSLGGDKPINAGDYRISVKIDTADSIGETSTNFKITQKPVTVTAKSQTIKAGQSPMDITKPELNIHYSIDAKDVNDIGPVKMGYEQHNISNPGEYDIYIGVLPERINPNYDVTFVAGKLIIEPSDADNSYTINIENGIANKTTAKEGEIVEIVADKIDGKEFVEWTSTSSGVVFNSPNSLTTTFKMPANNVNIVAKYIQNNINTDNIVLDKNNINLNVGDTTNIKATVLPENASDKTVSWSVEGDAVYIEEINENTIKVVAKKEGNATIFVKTRNGEHIAKCSINVTSSSLGGGQFSSGGAVISSSQNTTQQPQNTVQTTENKTKIVAEAQITPDGKIVSNVVIPNDKPQTVIIKGIDNSNKMVSFIVDENGNKKPIKYSYATEEGLLVNLDKSATIEVYDNSKSFKDVSKNDWYSESVDFVTSRELFFGTTKDKFSPEASMTRGMFAEVLYRLEDRPVATEKNVFLDVNKSDYFADAVVWASNNGIINGFGNGNFSPNTHITKEQLAVMLHKLSGDETYVEITNNTDLENVSPWAYESVNWALQNGIISSSSEIFSKPKEIVTRAEVSNILLNYVKNKINGK